MGCSEITLREVISKIDIFYPIKVTYNDMELYNDYDSHKVIDIWEDGSEIYGEVLPPLRVIPTRMKGLEDRIVTDIHIEIEDFHHSIVTIKGE